MRRRALWLVGLVCLVPAVGRSAGAAYRLATFSADVTIPLGHRCMGVLPVKSQRIADPLFAHGFVLLGPDAPIVLCAVDWCEIRNGAYDQWRAALAEAAATTRDRVLVSALHQHDAPVVDVEAARLLASVGLRGELYDEVFHAAALGRVVGALRAGLARAVAVTHYGIGEARVEQVASNRRVVGPDGKVTFNRSSRAAADPRMAAAPDGLVDPFLKTLSFWSGDRPVLALHAYATHPMSRYGRGEVSADFVGLARERRQRDDSGVKQIYVAGCSGDVTAGRYNDGSPTMRPILAGRLYQAMLQAWGATRRLPLERVAFRSTTFDLPFHPDPALAETALEAALHDANRTVEQRILAAMGLASRRRVAAGQPIEIPALDLGGARVVLLPGEAFVGFQLTAQRLRPDAFVMAIGYGESWTGYIPTEAAFTDGFRDPWLWVGPGSEAILRRALERVLVAHPTSP